MPCTELKEMIRAKFGSEASMARSIGWSRQRLNKITTGVKEPDVGELSAIANGLGEPVGVIADIFLR